MSKPLVESWTVVDFTPDATPKDIAKVPIAEGEAVAIFIVAAVREHDGPAAERAGYHYLALFSRAMNGNVVDDGQVAASAVEVTGTMDITSAEDTTAQTADIIGTGVAATTMKWVLHITVVRSAL